MSEARYLRDDALVTTEWLAAHLSDPGLRIYDCTTYLAPPTAPDRPYDVVSGREDYEAGHIPGSAFLDLQGELSDPASRFRFTMLRAERLAEAVSVRGIGDGTRVVLYSRKSPMWATRVWWMLRAIGFDAAAVLDGGWDKWAVEGREVSHAPAEYPPARLVAKPRPKLFVGRDEVLAAIADGAVCTINALAPDAHSGEAARYGRPGRVPRSVNVPAAALLDTETMEMPEAPVAADAFAGVGAQTAERVIVYCGGGIAATLDAFLLHRLGYDDIAVYDNSMSEWATDDSLPIETG